MHSESKIKRSGGFSLSPSRKEGLSTPKAPARLCSLHLPVTSHCFWNQAHSRQLSGIIWGGGSWLFTTLPPNVSKRERWSCTTMLCLAVQRSFPWSDGQASVHMLCSQPGMKQKCPWCTLCTGTPTTCTPHWRSQYLFPAHQRQLQVSTWAGPFQQESTGQELLHTHAKMHCSRGFLAHP